MVTKSQEKRLSSLLHDRKIKAVIFDLDGTLYSSADGLEQQIRPAMRKQTMKALNISEDKARELMVRYRNEYGHGVLGLQKEYGVDPKRFLAAVFSGLDRSVIQPYKGLENHIKALSALAPLYLVTNSNTDHAQAVLSALKLKSYFTRIFSIEDLYYRLKPLGTGYENILRRIDVPAQSVLVFDDSYLNLETARKLGMRTVLVSNGLAKRPLFYEMHKMKEHDAPKWVDGSTDHITDFLGSLLNHEH